jgi:hypothetical protein
LFLLAFREVEEDLETKVVGLEGLKAETEATARVRVARESFIVEL